MFVSYEDLVVAAVETYAVVQIPGRIWTKLPDTFQKAILKTLGVFLHSLTLSDA